MNSLQMLSHLLVVRQRLCQNMPSRLVILDVPCDFLIFESWHVPSPLHACRPSLTWVRMLSMSDWQTEAKRPRDNQSDLLQTREESSEWEVCNSVCQQIAFSQRFWTSRLLFPSLVSFFVTRTWHVKKCYNSPYSVIVVISKESSCSKAMTLGKERKQFWSSWPPSSPLWPFNARPFMAESQSKNRHKNLIYENLWS